MTNEEVRDELARLKGWFPPGTPPPLDQPPSAMRQAMSRQWVHGCWWRVAAGALVRSREHPFPATLDGANAAVPEGWEWWKDATDWIAQAPNSEFVYVRNTGDEIADRYRLAVLCRLAEKEGKR